MNTNDHPDALQAWQSALPGELQPAKTSYISEEELLEAIASKVAEMLHYNNGVFFQLMYKMDVQEALLAAALREADPAKAMARLILDRQIKAWRSRKDNPPPFPSGDVPAW